MVPLIASNILSIPSFLLIADQHGYARSFVSETVNSISFIIQIIIMLLFPQFDVLVISLIMFVCSLGGNVLNYLLAIKHYPYIKTINPTTDYFQWDVPQKMSQSLGASIANSVMTSVDTFMLAYCCPTTSSESLTLISVLTLYNGCISMVKNMLSNMLKQLTSSFGNLYVTCRQRFRNIFYSYLKICLLLLISVFITVNVVITRFIALFYDTNLLLSTVFVIVIVLNALLEVLQVPLLMLPVDICGNYGYKGKVMTFEAIGNVVLSYILLYIMGPIGLFVATLIIQVLVCIIIIPVTMVKYLEDSLKQYVAIILYFSVIYLMDGIILNWIFNLININSILLWFIASGLLLILCVAVNSFISFLVYPDLFSVFKNILFTIFRRPIE